MARGSNGPEDSQFAVCEDFVATGGISGEDGSCCKADNELFDGWCLKVRLTRRWLGSDSALHKCTSWKVRIASRVRMACSQVPMVTYKGEHERNPLVLNLQQWAVRCLQEIAWMPPVQDHVLPQCHCVRWSQLLVAGGEPGQHDAVGGSVRPAVALVRDHALGGGPARWA